VTFAATLFFLLAMPVAAQEAKPPDPEQEAARPWAAGVSAERQAEALRLFREGNDAFEQGRYAQALSAYRKAIASWNHPAIQFNMAVSLIQLDQPLDAYESLRQALRYGEAALEPQVFAQAQTYKKLLLGQLAQLKVGCSEPDAKVFLDGRQLLIGPGESRKILLPGNHQIVASKAGFLTATRPVTLVAGKESVETIELVSMKQLARTERRWKSWKPWAVMGGGVAVAALGVALNLDARSGIESYDAAFASLCPQGCRADDPRLAHARDVQDGAQLENGFGISFMITGGALVASGVVMLILNQPRLVEPENRPSLVSHLRLNAGPSGAGVLVVGRF
jgi:tetratricopeptide (TPR) repeat protein